MRALKTTTTGLGLALLLTLVGCEGGLYSQLNPLAGEATGARAQERNGNWFDGEILVGYEDAAALAGIAAAVGGRVTETIEPIRAARLALPAGTDVPDALSALSRENVPGLRYAEPNYIRQRTPGPDRGRATDAIQEVEGTPKPGQSGRFTDPLRARQWALDAMEAERAWEVATGRGVVVAVVDEGVQGTHPDLNGKMVAGMDCLSGERVAPNADSTQGVRDHGTHVAGIAAAWGDNGEGIVGVAPEASIMDLPIAREELAGDNNPWGYVGDANVARCILWAATIGPDGVEHSGDEAAVLNNSWGGRGYGQTLKEAVEEVVRAGTVFVNSMGNSSEDEVLYPKGYSGVLGVGATTPYDERTGFSTMGGLISVGAPGDEILSTVPTWARRPTGEPYGYQYWDGTSMAAPQVAGAVALLVERHPEATAYQLQKILEQTADDIEAPGFDRESGWGRINLARAVRAPLPPDGGSALVRIVTQNAGPGGQPAPVPFADVVLRRDGVIEEFAQTNARGVAGFVNLAPGRYEVQVAGGDAVLQNFRPANRVTRDASLTVASGQRAELEVALNTELRVTARWSADVDVDLQVGEPAAGGEVAWASPKAGGRWGSFSGDNGTGFGGFEERYLLAPEHFPNAAYPLALSAEHASGPASVTVTVEQNGVVESYGPYELQPGEVLPSTEWVDWWENFPHPDEGTGRGPGGPWVY